MRSDLTFLSYIVYRVIVFFVDTVYIEKLDKTYLGLLFYTFTMLYNHLTYKEEGGYSG